MAATDATIQIGTKSYSRGELSRGADISLSHVSRIFSGTRVPSVSMLERIAEYTGETAGVVLEAVRAHVRTELERKYNSSGSETQHPPITAEITAQ